MGLGPTWIPVNFDPIMITKLFTVLCHVLPGDTLCQINTVSSYILHALAEVCALGVLEITLPDASDKWINIAISVYNMLHSYEH